MLKLATSASKNQAASGLSEGHVMILRYVPHTTYVIYKTNFGTVEYHIPMDHAVGDVVVVELCVSMVGCYRTGCHMLCRGIQIFL